MNAANDRLRKSGTLVVALLVMTLLVACGGDDGGDGHPGDSSDNNRSGVQMDPAGNNAESAVDDEATERYREKVSRRVSASVASSLAREWGVSEAKVECILADLRVSQLEDANSDTAVAAVFDKCGVDPKAIE